MTINKYEYQPWISLYGTVEFFLYMSDLVNCNNVTE